MDSIRRAGYHSKSGLVPIPTFAVETFLDELFSGVQELTEQSFFDQSPHSCL